MSGYGAFARVYDALSGDIPYASMRRVVGQYVPKGGLVCDLGCGTATLAVGLAQDGYEVIGVDASTDMLALAQQKALACEVQITFLCQPMEELDLYGTVDAMLCTMDSLNHLDGEVAVQAAIKRAALFLNQGGVFLFDVNTQYKHTCVLADHVFVLETDGLYCVWKNHCKHDYSVDVELDFFTRQSDGRYVRGSETFCERVYDEQWIKDTLTQCGFHIKEIWQDYDGTLPGPQSERLVFIAEKEG